MTDSAVTLEFVDQHFVDQDAKHAPRLAFVTIGSRTQDLTVVVSGDRDAVVDYLVNVYSEGDTGMAAELIERIITVQS